ncbi:MAG TPA: metal-dependent hydrolase [Gemmatimonadaceae bacterium]|nr:metal-dependent hydrolase [Gemmatimonadaceae bacterium]
MYIGHVGAALAAKRVRKSIGLLVLLVATYTPDWVDTGLCVVRRYNDDQLYSHSIPAVLLFALIAFALYALVSRDAKGALVVGAVILSHMFLDWITGYKPTWAGGPMIGLRLYDHPMADFVIEALVIALGAALYARTLPARARGETGRQPGTAGTRRWSDATIMFAALLGLQLAVDFGHLVMRNIAKC